jgi:UDP-N-acetylmuramoylalanine--D-glutamate ligase
MGSFVKKFSGKNILIVGAGVTGKSCAKVLTKFEANVTLFDEKIAEKSTSEYKLINEISASSSSEPTTFDLAVVSPGWRLDHPVIKKLRDLKIPLISEVDLAWQIKTELAPNQRWIALTGTNGKTTTIQMVQSIFDAAKVNGKACGNVGETVIESVTKSPSFDYLALELSSFQIAWSELPTFSAVSILNIAEDHLDWHGSFESYAAAKLKLTNQAKVVILNKTDSEITSRAGVKGEKLNGNNQNIVWYSLQTPKIGEIGLVENLIIDRAFGDSQSADEIAELSDIKPTVPHNVLNAMAAAALCLAIGISHKFIKQGLANFKTDHHRLELVARENEISWVDDSKATNPHAAEAALLAHEKVVWIAGGLAKGAQMRDLIANCHNRIRAAILIGQDRKLISDAMAEIAPKIPIFLVDGENSDELMEKVVKKAAEIAVANDTVLLAPACASMDQFISYAHRGELFANAVKKSLKVAAI